jgi:hypothetical protein
MLPGIIGMLAGLGGSVREFSYIGISSADSIDTGTEIATFNTVSFGAAATGRRLFFSVHWQEGGTHRTISSVTVGGTSATVHSQGGHSGGLTGFGVALCSVAKDASASGTVLVTFSSALGVSSCHLTCIRAVGLVNSSPHDTASDSSALTSTSLSTTIDVPEDGLLIAAFTGSSFADKTGTWSGVTEEFDNGGSGSSLAWDYDMAAQSGRTIEFIVATEADSGNHMLVLSWA